MNAVLGEFQSDLVALFDVNVPLDFDVRLHSVDHDDVVHVPPRLDDLYGADEGVRSLGVGELDVLRTDPEDDRLASLDQRRVRVRQAVVERLAGGFLTADRQVEESSWRVRRWTQRRTGCWTSVISQPLSGDGIRLRISRTVPRSSVTEIRRCSCASDRGRG